jgi:opacity protein-like surface antigen
VRGLLLIPLALTWTSGAPQGIDPGAYIGGGIATFDYEQHLPQSLRLTNCCAGTATGIKLYGGYRLENLWSFEGSYEVTDKAQDTAEGTLPAVGFVTATSGAEFAVLSFRAMRHVPFPWGSFFVGGGYFVGEWDARLEADDGVTVHRFEETSTEHGLTTILGLQWDLATVSLRVEYEWWDVDDADPAQIAFGAHYRF